MRAARHASRVLAGRLTRRAIVTGGALLAASLVAPAPDLAVASPAALSGVHVFGWGFSNPAAIASDDTHVWVANGDSVTELSATTGGLVKVISGSRYKFDNLAAIAADGTHVWVASFDGNSVTELSATTGGLVKVISGSRYKFSHPDAIAADGTYVWVGNEGSSVTELSAKTGGLSR